MLGVAVVAAHHQTADAFAGQQSLIDREVGEVGFHGDALLGIQRLTGLECVQSRRRIARVIGERIGRQAWWQVVAHVSTLREHPWERAGSHSGEPIG
jgi:hypothetical protein